MSTYGSFFVIEAVREEEYEPMYLSFNEETGSLMLSTIFYATHFATCDEAKATLYRILGDLYAIPTLFKHKVDSIQIRPCEFKIGSPII